MVFKERLFSSSLCGTGLHLLHRKKKVLVIHITSTEPRGASDASLHLQTCQAQQHPQNFSQEGRAVWESDTRKNYCKQIISESSDIPEVFFSIKTRINMSKTLLTPGGRKIMFVKKCLGISLESFRHAEGTGVENLLQLGAHHSEWTLDRENPGVGFKVLFFGSQRRFGSDLDQRTAFCTRTPSPIVC